MPVHDARRIGRTLLIRRLAAPALLAASAAGCAGHERARPEASERLLARAPLQHVVLVELADRSDLEPMRADSDRLIPTIPGVRGYLSGTHLELGRPSVTGDYDLAIVVEFDSIEAYRAYLDHPAHLELVRTWRPKWRRATMYDFASAVIADPAPR